MIMKTKLLIIAIAFFGFTSCSDATLQQELKETKAKLTAAETQLAEANTDIKTAIYPLTHVVYFKLKPDTDPAKLITEINKLKEIDVLHDLEIGTFEDLGDKRALSDYQVMMSMAFANKADYKTYQAHEIHLGLKVAAKEMLAAPPATYDYMK